MPSSDFYLINSDKDKFYITDIKEQKLDVMKINYEKMKNEY